MSPSSDWIPERHQGLIAFFGSGAVLGGLYSFLYAGAHSYYERLALTPHLAGAQRDELIASAVLIVGLYGAIFIPVGSVALLVIRSETPTMNAGAFVVALGGISGGSFFLVAGRSSLSLPQALAAIVISYATLVIALLLAWRSASSHVARLESTTRAARLARWTLVRGQQVRSLVIVVLLLAPALLGLELNLAARRAADSVLATGHYPPQTVFGVSVSGLLNLTVRTVLPCSLGLGEDGTPMHLRGAVVVGWSDGAAYLLGIAGPAGFRGISAGRPVSFMVPASTVSINPNGTEPYWDTSPGVTERDRGECMTM